MFDYHDISQSASSILQKTIFLDTDLLCADLEEIKNQYSNYTTRLQAKEKAYLFLLMRGCSVVSITETLYPHLADNEEILYDTKKKTVQPYISKVIYNLILDFLNTLQDTQELTLEDRKELGSILANFQALRETSDAERETTEHKKRRKSTSKEWSRIALFLVNNNYRLPLSYIAFILQKDKMPN